MITLTPSILAGVGSGREVSRLVMSSSVTVFLKVILNLGGELGRTKALDNDLDLAPL